MLASKFQQVASKMQHAKAPFRPFSQNPTNRKLHSPCRRAKKKKKKEADQTEDNLIKLFNNGNGFPTLRSTQNLVRSCSRDYTRQKACTKKN
jgi:hypothetical protein